MNSLISRFGLAAAALCGFALAACNAVEDVREKPSTPVPLEQEVVKGTVTGLGYRRPLVLEDTGLARCTDPVNTTGPKIFCRYSFFGNFDESISHFSFGSYDVGTPYNVTVRNQPFGKICSFTGISQGTIVASSNIDIGITCINDPAITRYCVGGTLDPTIRSIPGLRISLTTEEGLRVLSDDPTASPDGPLPSSATGCWFNNAIFNSGSSLPILRWYVTASYPAAGQLANCRVLGGAANNGSNDLGDNTIVSNANVTTVTIPACTFTVGGTVGYSQPAGITYTPQTITGMVLSMRDTTGSIAKDIANTDVNYTVPSVTPAAPGTATTAYTLGGGTPQRFYSNPTALWDVEIKTQPAGQFCLLAATGVTIPVTPAGSSTVYPAGAQITGGASARLVSPNAPLTNTSTVVGWATFADLTNLAVRCRALPGTSANPSAALGGSYQVTTNVRTVVTITNPSLPTTGAPSDTTVISRTRNFLTFFTDGSFIYATRTGGSGVERGFYNYNTSTGTLAFTLLTDTNNTYGAGATLTTTPQGISALTSTSLTSVAKTTGNPGRITAFVSTTATNNATANTTSTVTTTWQLDEPTSVPSRMEGTWATADHRRVFIYNHSTTYGTHVGLAGAATFQDACFFLYRDDGVPSYDILDGYYARRGTSANGTGSTSGGSETSTGCPIANTQPLPGQTAPAAATLDYYAPALSQLPGYAWRLPGGQSGFDGRSPSPNPFTITPGTAGAPDSITITATNQGVLLPATAVTFLRTRSN